MKKKSFNRLIMLARQEMSPAVDVADNVVSALRFGVRTACTYKTYMWMSVASAVAACIVIAATVAWRMQTDSVNEMLTYVSWAAL